MRSHHLVGLQAQEPLEPYAGLWSRLQDFRPAELVELLESRRAVRTLMMRRTLHLLSADDCVAMRPLFQAMLVQKVRSGLGRRLDGVDLDELAAAGRPLFHERPRILNEVARAVADRWPEAVVRDLGDALSSLVELVQVPPRGVWGRQAPAANTTIEAWLGIRAPPGDRPGRRGAPLPARLRPGEQLRRTVLVGPDRTARRDQEAATRAGRLPRRAGPRAARPRGRDAPRPRPAGAATVPAGVRQRGAGVRRPVPDHRRRAPRA